MSAKNTKTKCRCYHPTASNPCHFHQCRHPLNEHPESTKLVSAKAFKSFDEHVRGNKSIERETLDEIIQEVIQK